MKQNKKRIIRNHGFAFDALVFIILFIILLFFITA